ncbi:uncharacterized protein [Ptychodera flava]|uniref:uncharacterized protein isoform X2 n=1 Tax=Ptychodera flava TaxID=63121 RepID=UPI00396A5F7F
MCDRSPSKMADNDALSRLVEDDTASNRGTGKRCRGKSLTFIYLNCYFVTIATILGTGILGLPVTLSSSGLYPFLVSFAIGYIIQGLLIYFFTDLLQRAYAVQAEKGKALGTEQESIPLQQVEDEDDDDEEDEVFSRDNVQNGGSKVDFSDGMLAGHVIIPKGEEIQYPNLHMLGALFLPCCIRQLFDVVIFLHFIAILISYALAGSEAYAVLINTNHLYVIPVFVWVLAFAIVFARSCIQPVVSVLTFIKGSLLVATVAVTFIIGTEVANEVDNDFRYIGSPFLMGTVALGGVINVMPMLFGKIAPVETQVKGFFRSVFAGLTTCAVLNIIWCWAILEIVPQLDCLPGLMGRQVADNSSMVTPSAQPTSTGTAAVSIATATATQTAKQTVTQVAAALSSSPSSSFLPTSTASVWNCLQNISLYNSKQQGEISTIPLIKIIETEYPQFNWVAILVEMFIIISITVSFLTIGSALVHTLSGWLDSLWTQDHFINYAAVHVKSKCECCSGKCVCRSFLSLAAFGIVFSVAMLEPKGFVTMLDKVASLVLNLEAGFFVFVMIKMSRRKNYKDLKVPWRLNRFIYPFHYLVFIYFTFAVFYDVFVTIYEIVMKKELRF